MPLNRDVCAVDVMPQPTTTTTTRTITAKNTLNGEYRIGNLPFSVYLPRLRDIEARVTMRLNFIHGGAHDFGKLGCRRLGATPFIRAAGRDRHLFPVPAPG